jgi:plastocyanin
MRGILPLVALALMIACHKAPSERDSPVVPRIAVDHDPSAGDVSGTVYFQGVPPQPIAIDMRSDSGCKGSNYSETRIVHEGKLQNVFVYIDGGFTFSPSLEPVVVEQQGCRYLPHVIAVEVTEPVQFLNLDPTNHNILGMPRANPRWNSSQPSAAPPEARSFAHAENMIPVKCNQHPWMKMYINVSQSPFYAVTDAKGHFAFRGVPPGTYDLVFVHESLGEQRHTITVRPHRQETVDVGFGP